MHFHLPKPMHGWRAFVGEVGIIVIGVLLALGAEQAVEALHHRSQVHEATENLHAESVANRAPLNSNVLGLQQSQRSIDTNLSVLGSCAGTSEVEVGNLVPVEQSIYLVPLDNAWLGVRDSALLPLLPARLSDSYFKLDTIKDLMLPSLHDVERARTEASARVEAMRRGLRDRESCRDTMVQLLQLRGTEEILLTQTAGYREFNEEALRGELVDALVRPGPLDTPQGAHQ